MYYLPQYLIEGYGQRRGRSLRTSSVQKHSRGEDLELFLETWVELRQKVKGRITPFSQAPTWGRRCVSCWEGTNWLEIQAVTGRKSIYEVLKYRLRSLLESRDAVSTKWKLRGALGQGSESFVSTGHIKNSVVLEMYWVGQKVCSDFSIWCYRQNRMNFLANPIHSHGWSSWAEGFEEQQDS